MYNFWNFHLYIHVSVSLPQTYNYHDGQNINEKHALNKLERCVDVVSNKLFNGFTLWKYIKLRYVHLSGKHLVEPWIEIVVSTGSSNPEEKLRNVPKNINTSMTKLACRRCTWSIPCPLPIVIVYSKLLDSLRGKTKLLCRTNKSNYSWLVSPGTKPWLGLLCAFWPGSGLSWGLRADRSEHSGWYIYGWQFIFIKTSSTHE